MSVTEELQEPEWLGGVRKTERYGRQGLREWATPLEGLDLTWHCRHHSLCTLQALCFPQFQQQPDRAPPALR